MQSVVNTIVSLPIQQWNGLSMLNMLEFGMFAGIIFWFSARMINNHSNELAVQQEAYLSSNEYAWQDNFTDQTSIEGATESWNSGYHETSLEQNRDDIENGKG